LSTKISPIFETFLKFFIIYLKCVFWLEIKDMAAKSNFEDIKRLLKRHNQGHLLSFWGQLNRTQRRDLLAQIKQFDFSRIDEWVAEYVKQPVSAAIGDDFTPAPYYRVEPYDVEESGKYRLARGLGKELISRGKVAGSPAVRGHDLVSMVPRGIFPSVLLKIKHCFRFSLNLSQQFQRNIKLFARGI